MKTARLLLVFGSLLFVSVAAFAASTEQQLQALKAQFPSVHVQKVRVEFKDRFDTIEIQVPHIDVWSKYHGAVLSANLASLPIVVARLEASAKTDADALRQQANTASGKSARRQADLTARWLTGPLQGYLKQLKTLQASNK